LDRFNFGKIGSFVQQDDVLNDSLTARELFTFAVKIRLDLKTEREVAAQVNSMITRLSLKACADQRIGGWLRHGVSGGERRRISIGYEMISNPKLLLLDEPTSGLDSTTASRVIKMLR
jgi:ATP-binding cassette subfamily G (WHITE) protein 2